MTPQQLKLLVPVMGLLLCSNSHAQGVLPGLNGPYLGQKPPGLTPEVFAPGLVSTSEWGDAVHFAPDKEVLYVSRWRMNKGQRETAHVVFKRAAEGWQKVVTKQTGRAPYYSPDGQRVFYGKQYKTRTSDGWSEMKKLGPAFDEIPIMGLKMSRKGTLVFDEFTRDGNGILRYANWDKGEWQTPKAFSKAINTGKWNAHPFIAPDESYVMWDGEREQGFGSSDLYISFRQPDGAWGEAINLGERVNTAAEEGGPQVTPDGKYLFFNRMVKPKGEAGEAQSDLFWVDAKIIDDLRPVY
ncbi:hypothetical protein C3B51_01370 [Pseudoalteromonas rubra]|uniref:WD40-like Beta Propeller Repeat n=1 Tax=Pseudoalteromonas rubra TaxID=43658 RepID=A0A4Q7ELA6_9GAMM|nr:PD40 domain-containing protein [Pseudoalteromonas rubra]RZM85066.1 hypothetical protein C3B51_01370 [Pseudoalteromonas rubra]